MYGHISCIDLFHQHLLYIKKKEQLHNIMYNLRITKLEVSNYTEVFDGCELFSSSTINQFGYMQVYNQDLVKTQFLL